MLLPDDVAATSTLAVPLPLDHFEHSTTGIRCVEPPLASHLDTINNQLASSASPALSTMGMSWDTVQLATTSNKEMAQLVPFILSGFPQFRHELSPALQEYHQFREHLYTVNGVILYKDCIVISSLLQQYVLNMLHSAHQGMISMTVCAETTLYWPIITSAIKALQVNRDHCNSMAPSQPNASPYLPTPPSYPFQCVRADFFHYKGVNYLVVYATKTDLSSNGHKKA